MDACDLSRRPPRSPRERLAGLDLLMLARTVDKLRATLPGGNLGAYKIPGFSARLLELLGIGEEELRAIVAGAASDEELAQWVQRHSDPQRYPEINAAFERRRIADVLGDPDFMRRYPLYAQLPPETPLIDALVLDDAAMFAEHG